MKIDLQLHSLCSDGYHTPAQLARMLKVNNIKVASLTDHNTVAGQKEFKKACQKYGIKTIPGLELYVRYKGKTFNLLWYNYQLDSPELQKMLESTWRRRRHFAEKVNMRLKRLGLRSNLQKFIAGHPYYLPVNHWNDILWRSRHNRKIIKRILHDNEGEESFLRYCFYPKTGARFQEARVSLTRVLKLRKQIGGQLIFCHPGLNNKLKNNLLEILIEAGIDGLEILSPHHSYSTIFYLSLAIKKHKLIATGGSDFHKAGEPGTKTRYAWNWFNIDSDYLSNIKKVIDYRK
jgi:predicted metal-dependent phosphoesterase TrpH